MRAPEGVSENNAGPGRIARPGLVASSPVLRPILLALFLLTPAAQAGDLPYDSSLLGWLEAVATRVEQRLGADDVTALSLRVTGGVGIDEQKASRVFERRLRARLGDAGIRAGSGGAELLLALSLDSGVAWAVGELDGPGMPGPQAVAVSWPADRELELVLGSAPARTGQGRWTLERLGTAPPGVLDALLLDVDGRDGDEIVLLGVDGVSTWLYDAGDPRPVPLGGPYPLGPGAWPPLVAGWLASEGGDLLAADTAHGLHRVDLRGRREAEEPAVPLRQPPAGDLPAVILMGLGSLPDLVPPAWPQGALWAPAPAEVRDLHLLPDDGGAIWVDAAGRLGGVFPEGGQRTLPSGAVGDRVVVADLDRDGRLDLASSEASGPGDPDRLSVHRLDAQTASLLFRASFDGAIVALAEGDLDFDGRPDLLVVEDGALSTLWRLERTR